MSTLKDQILARHAKPQLPPTKLGEIDCFILPWNERERIEWVIHCQASYDGLNPVQAAAKGSRAELIARSVCDENGDLIFGAGQGPEIEALRIDLHECYDQVIAVQRLGKDDSGDDAKKN